MAKRMGAQLLAIVTQGKNGRNYYAASPEHEEKAVDVEAIGDPLAN